MNIFDTIKQKLGERGFRISSGDTGRPWGGFYVIDEEQAGQFVEEYFKESDQKDLIEGRKVSPKILVVAPGKRLSWQYHHRRSEVWRVVEGEVGIIRSMTDEQKDVEHLKSGDVVTLAQGERHRLVGLEGWAILAEIWQHTDPEHPSDEEDIVRVEDDFGRGTPS